MGTVPQTKEVSYTFRGIRLFTYSTDTQQMSMSCDEPGVDCNFNFCNFIPDDYKLLSDFFDQAHKHATGNLRTVFLKDIDVS